MNHAVSRSTAAASAAAGSVSGIGPGAATAPDVSDAGS